MSPTAVLLMLSSGLSLPPACFPLHYIFVKRSSTWSEARSYCRERHTDLAPVHNQEDLAQLTQLTDQTPNFWIGLQPDRESWRWSLEDPDYYGEGEADFRNWRPGQPSRSEDFWRVCVMTDPNGLWLDTYSSKKIPSLCYDENANDSIIPINTEMNFDEAQSYCRTHHTDLASIRNQAENDRLKIPAPYAWIGLSRVGWKWADGSPLSFSNWAPEFPQGTFANACGASISGLWVNENCDNKKPFVCYEVPKVVTETRRVKVVLRRSGSSVDMEELQEGILEEFNRRVKQLGLNADIKLRWVKQPDGKIFHKQEEED